MEIYQELKDENIIIPLVISDYLMPNITGDKILEKINTDNPSIRTILLTGQANVGGIEYAVNKATTPEIRKARGVPPWAICTARPRTAKMPPPTIPPIPIATVDQKPMDFPLRGLMLIFTFHVSGGYDGSL